MKLLVVESPNKVRKIQGLLDDVSGPNVWRVVASAGHIRDLPMARGMALGDVIDVTSWKKIYAVTKPDVCARLSAASRSAAEVILATDPDREGEAIAWHLAEELGIREPRRITFHELTRAGVQKGLSSPRPLDRDLVEAQRARRVVDYLIGFELSPRLWPFGLKSAGRVQTAALRVVTERERAIQAFVPEAYWTVAATYREGLRATVAAFEAPTEEDLVENPDLDTTPKLRPKRFACREDADALVAEGRGVPHVVESVEGKPLRRRPPPPFTTSTLLGECASRFGWKPETTSALAQSLFEKGVVTYIRTDSTALAAEAIEEIRAHIAQHHQALLPSEPQIYADKASAQGAHEAIRPTHIESGDVAALEGDERELYDLIWVRTVACQCANAELLRTTITVAPSGCAWRLLASGTTVIEPGFMALLGKAGDEDDDVEDRLPRLNARQVLGLDELTARDQKTKAPARFTVKSLIAYLERKGIGRPSTLATIFATLTGRSYVKEHKRHLVPEEAGFLCDELTKIAWATLTDEAFTALTERTLDKIAAGKLERRAFLDAFYRGFLRMNSTADAGLAVFVAKNPLLHRDGAVEHDVPCARCGAKMLKRKGKFGEYATCLDEACGARLNLAPLKELAEPCPTCGGPVVEQPFLKEGKKARFFRCGACSWKSSYPPPKPTKWRCHVDPDHGKMVEVRYEKAGERRSFFLCNSCQHKAFTGPKPPPCPLCQAPDMAFRDGPRGPFWSCRTYPKCRGTADFTSTSSKKPRSAKSAPKRSPTE